MRTFLVAATGPPAILLTAALVVLGCFWLLVAVGVADVERFDTDVDLWGWRLDGVPVTVASSVRAFGTCHRAVAPHRPGGSAARRLGHDLPDRQAVAPLLPG